MIMKKLLVIITVFSLFSCKSSNVHTDDGTVIIKPVAKKDYPSDETRQLYIVTLSNGRVYEYMYAEEIANGLITGEWKSDEDLKLAWDSEYQVILEPDSMMIWDGGRKVAAVSYQKTGVLDSIFIKDNE